jgi:ParB family chromosome partitioning protein
MTDWIDIDRLQLAQSRPAGFVPRPNLSLLRRMQTHGAVEPVVVRPITKERFEILVRPDVWIAAGELSIHQVPAIILDDIDDDEAEELVREHYVTEEQDPVSEGEGFLALMERQGWWDGGRAAMPRGAISKVARAVGRSRPYVANAVRLLKLPDAILEEVRRGRLTVGQVRPLLGLSSRSEQLRLAERIRREGLTARAVEEAVKSGAISLATKPEAAAADETKSADIRRLEQQVTALIGAEFTLEQGRAVINYYDSLDILEGVLEKLGYKG